MKNTFVVITPAYNEAAYIGTTIDSVLSQTMLPTRWLIMDDGSKDETAAIVKKNMQSQSFIRYHYRKKPEGQAYFTSNVFAIMEGYELIRHEAFDFLAILDADILLPNRYYEQVLEFFATDSRLGVVSGVYVNLIAGKEHLALNDRRSTPKAITVFRREVFEQIGGYMPLQYGGEDTIACVKAKMAGWTVRSFPEIKAVHLRPTGMGAASSILAARFKQGKAEYHVGFHPVFFILKSLRRFVLEKPYVIGGIARIIGYLYAVVSGQKRIVATEVVSFLRKEQMNRLFSFNHYE